MTTTPKLELGGTITVGSAAVAWVAYWLPVAQFIASSVAIIVGILTLIGMYRRWKGK
jgi:hypothetical protein